MGTTKKRSLVEFMRDKRKKDCPVCRIPEELRQEMVAARTKKITRVDILAWLKEDHGIDVTPGQMDTHNSAKHDQKEF